ncbi:hypothetical protein C7974DRAFT_377164 [Boeremia exigua]|uniref:uncharacterized protein n=1 Tax=Boeremia exigua TaxID=749465 RepID=UPI001E8CE9FE|nr:uncharacterized protein C7974DRAFT_377164 [Boeremia exigua]KAH6625685.1 hypothetical protein C7974DRAFT_377164 [Boeremia exigua]
MQSEATITFTQPGVEPPVYVVTSLSTPPWAPLELALKKENTSSGDLVFEQKFANVAEGSYQYKIRIGEGHWVVDESKESATDEQGNRNNVVHVKPAPSHVGLARTTNGKDTLDRKDSTIDTGDMGPAPIPFLVVEKVEDEAQPEYGDVQPKSLTVDEGKRAADPEPDFEETKANSPLDVKTLEAPEAPEVPLVLAEMADDKPGHVSRSADASPDRSPEEPDELEPSETGVPLFRHESFQDSGESLPERPLEIIEEEYAWYSTDHTSTGDAMNTPSAESQDDLEDGDELDLVPLLSHETGFVGKGSKPNNAPLLSHEKGATAEESDEEGEFVQGPLLPHETGFTSQKKKVDDDYDQDNFDAAPLLPHETGFSSSENSDAASRKSRLSRDEYEYEPNHHMRYGAYSNDGKVSRVLGHALTFSHEQDMSAEDYGTPLLPHERGSAAESFSGSERSFSMSPTRYDAPVFGQDMDAAKESSASLRHAFFRTRTSSSTLPNKLPQSDAEDIDLHEPGLEHFPVGRDQILERVATIGNKLPEDETHGAPASPQSSVLSQACSSVDLVPVKSYISLASVREDEEEEDEEDNADVESLGSPMIMSHAGPRFARQKDPLATPHPDDSKQLGHTSQKKPETQSTHNVESSEASSFSKTDRSKDRGMRGLSDIVASRATVKNTLTPPLTPRTLEAPAFPEAGLRQRREAREETAEASSPRPQLDDKNEPVPSVKPDLVASAAEQLTLDKRSLHSWKGAR